MNAPTKGGVGEMSVRRPSRPTRPTRPTVRLAAMTALAVVTASSAVTALVGVTVVTPAGAAGSGVSTSHMLTLSDLPHGWTKTGTKVTSTTSQTLIATIAPCLGVTAPALVRVPSRTRSFNVTAPKGKSYTVFEGVSHFPSTSAAAAVWAVLTNTRTPGCTAAAFTKHLSDTASFTRTGLTVGPPVSSKLGATAYGSGTTTFSFRYTVKGSKTFTFTTRFRCIAVLEGRYLVEMFVTGLRPSASLLHQLVTGAEKHVG